jgi:cell division protein FtsL
MHTTRDASAWGTAVMRSLCFLAFGCLVGLMLYTYDLKLKTRAIEVEARDLIAALQDESDFLALMRAEVSYLSRPERIEDMARKTLKLEPIAPSQLVPWSAIVTGAGAPWQPQLVQSPQKDGIATLIEKAAGQTAVAR